MGQEYSQCEKVSEHMSKLMVLCTSRVYICQLWYLLTLRVVDINMAIMRGR
jgi:hypothetical protein